MKVWFLRITHPGIDRRVVRTAALAPILFRKIAITNLHVGMDAGEIAVVVNRAYKDQSQNARRQHGGSLRRFLSDEEVGDFVGIRVNRDPKMLFGRFIEGDLRKFPGFEKEDVKGRPFQLLTSNEKAELLKTGLAKSATSFPGTFCGWGQKSDEEIELPDESEKQCRLFYSAKPADNVRQVKFIRVGADLGCGQRLSRIFPGNYYHFIPIPQHNDPEFCRFTYGDVASRQGDKVATKGRSLISLRSGDMLVFYAGFDPEGQARVQRLVGIFGFFVVKEAFVFIAAKNKALRFSDQSRTFDPFKEFAKANPKQCRQDWDELTLRYGNWNEHLADRSSQRMDLMICADRKESKLLTRVEVLASFDPGTRNYIINASTGAKWGLTSGHDLKMSSVRTVKPECADVVFKRLKELS